MTTRPNDETIPDAPDCAGCDLPESRRRFLRDAFVSVAGALVAVGMSRASALAMPLEFTEGTRHANQTVSYPIPAADGAQIDKKNEVILVRWQGAVYAFNLSCPHQNAAVKWLPQDHRFQCTKHDSKYTPVGVYTSGRATRNMDRLPIRRDGDSVLVDINRMIQSDKDPSGWAAATVAL